MKLRIAMSGFVAVFAAALVPVTPAHAQQPDSPLLNELVKKGLLSDKEANDVRVSEEKEYSETPAAKFGISNSVQKVTFYGDVRYRFEYADEKAQAGATSAAAPATVGGENIVERNRYRLRVGANFVFTDHFNGGIELETNTANDSANQTFGNAYGKAPINVGLVFLQWKPVDWLTLTGGKFHNPLYSTDLEWDPDINPEGAAEAATWIFPFGGGSAPVSDPKDVKSMVAPADPGMSLSIGVTAFQGIYADNSEFNAFGTDNTDVWQFVEQVPIQFNFNKDTFIKEVPGFDVYTGGGNTGPGNAGAPAAAENGGGTQNFIAPNAADDLAIITAPGEFDWKAWKEPFRLYWDFAANLEGDARVQNVYLATTGALTPASAAAAFATKAQNASLGDNIAWLAGIQIGQNKKKGDWSIKGDFRQVGLGSIDPNENDSDWADSFLNQQGIRIQPTYNFTDFLTGSITVYDTWAYKSNLFAGQTTSNLQAGNTTTVTGTTTSLVGLAAASQTQRVDVDLQWKF